MTLLLVGDAVMAATQAATGCLNFNCDMFTSHVAFLGLNGNERKEQLKLMAMLSTRSWHWVIG